MHEGTAFKLCDDEKIGYKIQPTWCRTAPKGDVLLDDQLVESSGDIEVLAVVSEELVLVGFLEPFAPRFVNLGCEWASS